MAGPSSLPRVARPGGEAKEEEISWGEEPLKLSSPFFKVLALEEKRSQSYEFLNHPVSKQGNSDCNPRSYPFPAWTQAQNLRTRWPDRPHSQGRRDTGPCRDLIAIGYTVAFWPPDLTDLSQSSNDRVTFYFDPVAALTGITTICLITIR
ncbi:hypothetical protein Taro_042936 [Colocasia esculenta]|uniref:Uncharacterized protein n=1 Tax=Colocasia esculenta TaxID=4460 RepID=A0A843WU84_COLES|nr:hypothetical protein [Colocasia esculenta]